MHINLILIPFVIILGLFFSSKDTPRGRRNYIIICSLVLLLVAALRSPEWMTITYNIDTMNYKNMFEESFNMSWHELMSLAYLRYYSGVGDNDIGFLILNKAISLLTHDFHIYSILMDIIFFVPFGIILYRYTTKISQLIFAYVFYIALIQIFFLGGARQIAAMGFDLMALISLIDKKKFRTVAFFIIGLSIHFSSFLFLVPLLMIWSKMRPSSLKVVHIICFISFPIILSFPNELIVFMGEFIGMEKYADYGRGAIRGGASTFIFLIEMLSLFILFAINKQDILKSKVLQVFYVMAPLFTLFAPLTTSNGSMIRISLYYHLFLALLVPIAIDCAFIKTNRSIAYVTAIGALSLLSLSNGGLTYYFFWQV